MASSFSFHLAAAVFLVLADLDQRLAQLEQTILQKVQQAIENAIESFVPHFKKQYPQDQVLLCGDFNSRHVAWNYDSCSARGRRIMEDASKYDLSLLNTPQMHTRLGQTWRQADTTPDLTWATLPKLCTWSVLEDCLGSDHFPICIRVRHGSKATRRNNTGTRISHITHWDKYRLALDEEPPKAGIELLTQQLHEAKTAATKGLRVSQDHPDHDRHLLALWNRRLRLLTAYRKRGKPRRTKRRLRKIQNEIERYTSHLASEQWMQNCEQIS
ncbi:hypothetical protein HPB47_025876 [Ixodes persulcatus]|uniref:Uncharacterized protein n=1 Tax=Ixodes persulcatus TaxID=34615 RepID=A0AC60Q2B9_IXOPE|nr:hypothetical protein HPB47_025876 [Ixodes persulcatus]